MTKSRLSSLLLTGLSAALFCLSANTALALPAKNSQSKSPTPEEEVTGVYANHLATAMCGRDYRARFLDTSLTLQEKQQYDSHVAGACKCLYKNMAETMTPPEIIDYVMFSTAPEEYLGKPSQEYLAYIKSDAFKRGMQAFNDPKNRKKCGFVK